MCILLTPGEKGDDASAFTISSSIKQTFLWVYLITLSQIYFRINRLHKETAIDYSLAKCI